MSIKERFQKYIVYLFEEQRKKMLFDANAAYLKYHMANQELGITTKEYFNGKNVVVSLTTYGKRIYDVYLTIESIMRQTFLANKIILWLSEEWKDIEIPYTLASQAERGLEIKYCKDIRSYKKLLPTLKEFPKDIIVTIDDDVIYEIDTLERLINTYKKNTSAVCCNWAKRITFDKNGFPLKYTQWIDEQQEGENVADVPIGCAGVLYPPDSLDEEVFNEEVFMKICPYADDIWFKAMALKNGHSTNVSMRGTHEFMYYDNPLWQNKGLTQKNITEEMNDVQMNAVFEKYDLYKCLV